MSISTDEFRQSMALFPGAVTLITVGQGAARRGITATAVCSVTDRPPSLLACVNRDTATCEEIMRLDRFSVQLLGASDQDLALRFAGAGGVRGAEKFLAGNWSATQTGVPRLQTALASLACRVTSHSTQGSHQVFIGQIEEAFLAEAARDLAALVYARSQFRAVG
nr:flavin reductase family protein [uncultured Celeribacter sp.]